MKWFPLWSAFAVMFMAGMSEAADPANVEVISVQKIWDAAPHNAFTDLMWKDGKFYCVFREGDGHVSPHGALRVLSSPDGEKWTSEALITAEDSDLRDAKICLAPGNRFMLCGAGALHKKIDGHSHQSYIWYSDDAKNWSEAIPIGDLGFWLWRVTWHDDVAYAIGYSTGAKKSTRLYRSTDGKTFETIVPTLTSEGYPNESAMLFNEDGSALCVIRRDEKADAPAQLGFAKAPYTEWTWKSLETRVGGPQFIRIPDGRVVLAGRDYVGKAKTNLWWLDPQTAKLETIVTFPSGGDTSYPGLVFRDGLLWVSYYSSHEGKTSIYLAKVKLPAKS